LQLPPLPKLTIEKLWRRQYLSLKNYPQPGWQSFHLYCLNLLA
jgi:hypothetical protein